MATCSSSHLSSTWSWAWLDSAVSSEFNAGTESDSLAHCNSYSEVSWFDCLGSPSCVRSFDSSIGMLASDSPSYALGCVMSWSTTVAVDSTFQLLCEGIGPHRSSTESFHCLQTDPKCESCLGLWSRSLWLDSWRARQVSTNSLQILWPPHLSCQVARTSCGCKFHS